MTLTSQEKENLIKELAATLREEPEVVKVVVFGSFLNASEPHDLDVAVFQDSDQAYLPLAMKYRRKTRMIGRRIPLDIFPLKPGAPSNFMLDEIARGEVIYER
jgi:predicted nucleotidyltransferase